MSDYFSVCRSLWLNALVFYYHKLMFKPLNPEVVSLALTHRCDSHCIMCNIWKGSRELPDLKSREMSGAEIISILSDPLFSQVVELDLTGGETHLRDDLADLVISLTGLKEKYLPKLRSIVVASNGFRTERITSNYRRMLQGLLDSGVDLVSVNSLDGMGAMHDRIRGTRGAYDAVMKTIAEICKIRDENRGFYPGIKTTIFPENINQLDRILEFALAKNLFHIISPAFFTEGRFRNADQKKKLELKNQEDHKMAEFYGRSELAANYFYSQIRDFLSTGRKLWHCTAGYNYMFIEFDGKVSPCEMVADSVGDLRKQSPREIWHGESFENWRKNAKNIVRCRTCHEPGAVRYSAVTEGQSYSRFIRKLGRLHYGESFYREGYCKYLEE